MSAYPSPPDVLANRVLPYLGTWPQTADTLWTAHDGEAIHGPPREDKIREHLRNAVDWIEAEPSEAITLTFTDEGGEPNPRAIIVLTDSTGRRRRAFYRSSGRSGGAAKGEWIPFHGLVDRGRSELLRQVWLVKEGNAKFPDSYEQPEAYRAYHLLKWADRLGLIDYGWSVTAGGFGADSGTVAELKNAFEVIGQVNRWLQFKGVFNGGQRWRRPYPKADVSEYNQPFPYIGIDLHWPGQDLRVWAKKAGHSAEAVMAMPPRYALESAGIIEPKRRKNPTRRPR